MTVGLGCRPSTVGGICMCTTPSPLRSKLCLRQGALSDENAALAGRRARFQGIEFSKSSGGEVGGGRKHTHTPSAANLPGFWHRSRRDPPEASEFIPRRRGISTRKLRSCTRGTTHQTTQPTQPKLSQPESEETQKHDTGRVWCHALGKPSTMVSPEARLGTGTHTQKSSEQAAQGGARGAAGGSFAAEKQAAPAPGCNFQ